jgi:hypothetical protein
MRTRLEKAHDVSSIGTFVLTIVIVALMVLPMLHGSAETAAPGNHPAIGWVMPAVLAVCLLLAGLLNLLAARSRSLNLPAMPLPAPTPSFSGPTPADVPTPVDSEERIFVGANVTPELLLSFFKEHTAIQGQRLIEPFIGKWMRVSGNLSEVISSDPKRRAQVTFSGRGLRSDLADIYMYFRTADSIDRLSILRRGDSMTVVGQIVLVNPVQVDLDNCELESSS